MLLLLLLLRAASKPRGQSSNRGKSCSSRPQDPLLRLLMVPGSNRRGCSRSYSSSQVSLVQQSVRRLLPRYNLTQKSTRVQEWANVFRFCMSGMQAALLASEFSVALLWW